MTIRRALLALAILIPLAGARSLSAQPANLLGRAVLADSVTPARGAIIEATPAGAPGTRVRALVGANGSFLLNLPGAGEWRLSGMRVGYLPTPLGTFTARATEQVTLPRPLVLGATPVRFTLTAQQVDTTELCGRGPEESQRLVATLLAQARSALAATILSSPDGAATAEWQRFSIFTDRLGTPLTPMRIEQFSAATDRPLRAVDADSLARFGYLWDRTDHMRFNAPDAEVLLSESFVGSHCYRLSAPHPEREEWIGVSFVPAQQRRGIAEVRGTLWLDRATSELRRLEYLFVDLPAQFEAATPRGLVEFARLPGDIWVVTRWEMRLPRAGNAVTRNGTAVGNPVRELNAMQISGGELATVRRGDAVLFRSDVGPADRFPEVVARLGARPACLDSPTVPADESGIIYGTITDSLGRPVRGTARLNWTAIGRSRGTNFQRERNVSAVDGFFMFCNINVGPTLTLLVFDSEGRAGDPVKLRLQLRQPWAAVHRVIRE